MLVTPRSKKESLDYVNNFNFTTKKLQLLAKYANLMLGTYYLTNCFHFITVISTFDTASCVFFWFWISLSSNTYSCLANIYYIARRSWSYQFLLPFILSQLCFSSIAAKHFETDEKNSCRIAESINPFCNTIHWLVWWFDKECDEFNPCSMVSLFFGHYSVILPRYFWWNYLLKKFSLLVDLLRLVYLLMVGT